MKVKIGDYIPWYTTTRLERKYFKLRFNREDFEVKEAEYNRFDRFVVNFFEVLQDILNATINKILQKRERKIKIKLDPWDSWNADNTLAIIIAPVLRQLKETKNSAPLVNDEDVPDYLRSTAAPPKENEWDIDANHFVRWDWVMDEMIFAFEKIAEDNWESEFYSGEATFEATFGESTDVKDTFKVDLEGIKKVRDRIDNGTRLFGKYFSGLWC
jgi:hypothetical protein